MFFFLSNHNWFDSIHIVIIERIAHIRQSIRGKWYVVTLSSDYFYYSSTAAITAKTIFFNYHTTQDTILWNRRVRARTHRHKIMRLETNVCAARYLLTLYAWLFIPLWIFFDIACCIIFPNRFLSIFHANTLYIRLKQFERDSTRFKCWSIQFVRCTVRSIGICGIW